MSEKPRVIGPAITAFESEMHAEEMGEPWGPEDVDKWVWRPIPAPPARRREPPTSRATPQLLQPLVDATRPPPLVVNKNVVRRR